MKPRSGAGCKLLKGGLRFDPAVSEETNSLRNGTVVAGEPGEHLMFCLSVIP